MAFNFELFKNILTAAAAAVTFIAAVLIAFKTLRAGKVKKTESGETTEDGETILTNLSTYATMLLKLITKADTFQHYSGAEKLQYVLSNAMTQLITNGEAYDEETVTNDVNNLVAFTKSVNYKKAVY